MTRQEAALDQRVAVVTGASSGIGAAAARALARNGATVVVGYNDGATRAKEVVESLPGRGHRAVRMPVHDSAALGRAAEQIDQAFGRVDLLVNSAGITRRIAHDDLAALTDELFDATLAVNVRGPFATVRALRSLLERARDGALVVNVSSISASTGSGSSVAYCASKAALDSLGRSLARALAPHIRFLSVAPAAVDTDFVPGRTRDAVLRQAASTPLGQVCTPEDVAQAILACATHLGLATGSVVTIDGGKSLVG